MAKMAAFSAPGARSTVLVANAFRKPSNLLLIRTVASISHIHKPLLSTVSRQYATSDSIGGHKTSSRKQVTVRNDDGRVQWNDLTTVEKAARTTQQTFNFGVILVGVFGTVRLVLKSDLQEAHME